MVGDNSRRRLLRVKQEPCRQFHSDVFLSDAASETTWPDLPGSDMRDSKMNTAISDTPDEKGRECEASHQRRCRAPRISLSGMMSTRFLPMSCTSPLTVASTIVPFCTPDFFSIFGSR